MLAQASAGAMLVRNVVKLPELGLVVGPVYVLLSERRQRLGDLLARTLVVATPQERRPTRKKGS